MELRFKLHRVPLIPNATWSFSNEKTKKFWTSFSMFRWKHWRLCETCKYWRPTKRVLISQLGIWCFVLFYGNKTMICLNPRSIKPSETQMYFKRWSCLPGIRAREHVTNRWSYKLRYNIFFIMVKITQREICSQQNWSAESTIVSSRQCCPAAL